jgi:hypothetical protein
METTMLRKITLALVAAASLGAAALVPGTASAHGFHGGWHGGWGHGFWGGSALVVGASTDDCYQRQLVETRRGPRWRTVYVCNF